MRATTATALRFLVSGGTAATVDVCVFLLLRSAGANLVPANSVAVAAAFCTGFALNRHFTFRAHDSPVVGQLSRYGCAALLAYVVNTAGVVLLSHFGATDLAAKVGATAVSALLNFGMSRWWVFTPRGSDLSQPGGSTGP